MSSDNKTTEEKNIEVVKFDHETISKKLELLKTPLLPREIEWKVQASNENTTIVPYINSRSVYDRFDRLFGSRYSIETTNNTFQHELTYYESVGNGRKEKKFRPRISTGFTTKITIEGDGFTVSRVGCAEVSDVDPFKGGESDSLKRCAHAFGMGRELYRFPTVQIIGSHKYIPWAVENALDQLVKDITDKKIIKNFIKFTTDGKMV